MEKLVTIRTDRKDPCGVYHITFRKICKMDSQDSFVDAIVEKGYFKYFSESREIYIPIQNITSICIEE